ncbi:MAG: CdaR family protein [Oscillospiraceae bacterium]|nr:CdaR family protein [Oscillospiraceae bacterium]
MKMTSPMRKIYNSRAFWVVVSLLASLAIWIYVTSVESDVYKQTFRGIRVEIVGDDILRDSRNMVVTDLDTNTVTIEVSGPRRVVGSLDASDIVAQVDVSKLTQAAYTSLQYYISYPNGTDTASITELKRTPETVNFMVSKLTSKTIQVRGGFEGTLADGYTAETPVFEPSTITITGPDAYIKDVEYAWVTFGKDVTVSSTYSVDTGYTLMDEEGKPCSSEEISFSSDTVKATLPMLEIKDVMLGVDIVEGAGATKANTKITVEPESISLAGDSAILSGMNKIILGTIDLTDFASTYTETYTIPLDNNMKNLTGVTEAKVTIEIVGLETKTFKVKNFSCINVAEGSTAQIMTESIDIVLRGTAEDLAKVKNENIRAVADLTDFKDSTGAYMPVVKIYVDGFTGVGVIGENTISVEIRKAQ